MSQYIYLHYRATTSDPWIVSPALPLSAQSAPAGGIPLSDLSMGSGPEVATECGCAIGSDLTPDNYNNYLALKAVAPGLVQSEAFGVLQFLINYKNAALHEAKFAGYLTSDFVTASIGAITLKPASGLWQLGFRIASEIS